MVISRMRILHAPEKLPFMRSNCQPANRTLRQWKNSPLAKSLMVETLGQQPLTDFHMNSEPFDNLLVFFITVEREVRIITSIKD